MRKAKTFSPDLGALLAGALPLSALGSLATVLSHDYNNLLGALLARLQMAQKGLATESKSAGNIEKALEAVRRMAEMSGRLHSAAAAILRAPGTGELREIAARAAEAALGLCPALRLSPPAAGEPVPVQVSADLAALAALMVLRSFGSAGGEHAVRLSVGSGPLPSGLTGRIKGTVRDVYGCLTLVCTPAALDALTLEQIVLPLSAPERRYDVGLDLAAASNILRQQGGALELQQTGEKETIARLYL